RRRARASVDRIVAPYQAPGKTRSSVYLAAPVNLAGPSRRRGWPAALPRVAEPGLSTSASAADRSGATAGRGIVRVVTDDGSSGVGCSSWPRSVSPPAPGSSVLRPGAGPRWRERHDAERHGEVLDGPERERPDSVVDGERGEALVSEVRTVGLDQDRCHADVRPGGRHCAR